MQNELDTTRQEMRRGIFELPQETADTAAQMRRVVVEQIDALTELNRIVSRHGRAIDAVQAPARPSVREEGIAAVASATGQRIASRTENGSLGGGSTAAPSGTSSRGLGTSSWPEPTPQPAASSSPGDGWLHDVLTRAGRDDTAGPFDFGRLTDERQEFGTTIQTISLDIARMVIPDAASDFWDNRQRGEALRPSRDLYTAEGQQRFEDIRRKYRADADFRGTVDRYLSEFERLLDEVAQDTDGPQATHGYLTSETGKVYTVLAHAAGRLD
jgi:hypothetical protein